MEGGDKKFPELSLFVCSRNYLSSILIQELFLSLDHDELPLRAKVSLVLSVCTYEILIM